MRLHVALFVLCAMALCDQARGSHRTWVPSNGLRMPNRRYLIKWDTFVNKIAGRTMSAVIFLPTNASFPEAFRWDIHAVMTGQDTYDAYHTLRPTEKGECIAFLNQNITHAPEEKYAIDRAGTLVEGIFSFDPNLSYFFLVSCADEADIVNGVCTQNGVLFLLVRDFPPNQLNWGLIVRTLKRVMGLNFSDSRFRFIAGAEGCPDPAP